MSSIVGWLFHAVRPERNHVTANIYHVIYVVALIAAAFSFFRVFFGPSSTDFGVQVKPEFNFATVSAIGFGVATAVQQYFVYQDFHIIEYRSVEAREEYGSWLFERWEVAIRYIIIAFLLLGAGKLLAVVFPMLPIFTGLHCAGKPGTRLWPCELYELDGVYKEVPFLVGTIGVFFSLTIWNVGALAKRQLASQPDARATGRNPLKQFIVVGTALALILLTYFYWVMIWNSETQLLKVVSIVAAVIYLVALFVMSVKNVAARFFEGPGDSVGDAEKRRKRVREMVISLRIALFLISAGLCLAYWVCVATSERSWLQNYSAFVFLGYGFLFALVFALRFNRVLDFLTEKLCSVMQ